MGIHVELRQAIQTPVTREKLWSALAYALGLHKLFDEAGLIKEPVIVAIQAFGSIVTADTIEYHAYHLPPLPYEKLTHPALFGYIIEEWSTLLRSKIVKSRPMTRYTDAQLAIHWTAGCLDRECEGVTIVRAPRAPHAKSHGHVEIETTYIQDYHSSEIKHLIKEFIEAAEAHAAIVGRILEVLLKAYEHPSEVYASTSRRVDVAYYFDLRHPTRIIVGDQLALLDSYAAAFAAIGHLIDTYMPVIEADVASGKALEAEAKVAKLFRYIKKKELKPIIASEEIQKSIVQALAQKALHATAGSVIIVDKKPLQYTTKLLAQTLYTELHELAEEAEVLERKIASLEERVRKTR